MSNKIINTGEFVQILQMFDDMSRDLRIGRLTNSEKDILLKINHEIKTKGDDFVDIRLVKFKTSSEFEGLYGVISKEISIFPS